MAKKAKRGTREKGGAKKRKLPPMTPRMKFYYDAWLGRYKLFGDATDEHYFFLFVRACVQNSKTGGRDGHWLRQHLEKEGNIADYWIDKAASWFDICAAYEHSRQYYSGTDNPYQFDWQPKDYRPWKERLKDAT